MKHHTTTSAAFVLVSCIATLCIAACTSSAKPSTMQSPLDAGGNDFGNPSADSSLPSFDASGHFLTFADRPCPPGSTLSYQSFGAAFFANHCELCHASSMTGLARNGAPVGLFFDNQAEIQALRQKIWERAGDENHLMPPVGSVAMSERVQLGEWLACGAK